MITTDLSKEQVLNSDLKQIQQINFTGNLEPAVTILFILEEWKKKLFWIFLEEPCECCSFIML